MGMLSAVRLKGTQGRSNILEDNESKFYIHSLFDPESPPMAFILREY
jgi:hypothetical protein